MSKNSEQLVRKISGLVEAAEALSDVLDRYRRANVQLAARVEQGQPVLEAFDALEGAMQRHRELTETLEVFESARHHVRRALFALSTEQGASLSELGRRIGISRQLASRLAAEVDDGED